MRSLAVLLLASVGLPAQEKPFLETFFAGPTTPELKIESVAAGYLARPAGPGRLPGVLVLAGSRASAQQWTRELAGTGFAALSVAGDPARAADWLAAQPFADPQRLAAIAWPESAAGATGLARGHKLAALVVWGAAIPEGLGVPTLGIPARRDSEQAWTGLRIPGPARRGRLAASGARGGYHAGYQLQRGRPRPVGQVAGPAAGDAGTMGTSPLPGGHSGGGRQPAAQPPPPEGGPAGMEAARHRVSRCRHRAAEIHPGEGLSGHATIPGATHASLRGLSRSLPLNLSVKRPGRQPGRITSGFSRPRRGATACAPLPLSAAHHPE